MEIGAVIFMIVALICYAIIANSQGDGEIKGAASNIDNLLNDAQLAGASLWTITIFRKSGYLHDVREFRGDANAAIAKALTSCRKSGIYNIIITKNESTFLEFYSADQDGRGKTIGGFRISTEQDVAVPNLSKKTQTAVNDLDVLYEDVQRNLAKLLLDSIKPNMSEKQAEILGSLPEDEMIECMVSQMDGVERLSGEPYKFVIPLNYTCKDGVLYDDVPLTIYVGDNVPTDALTKSYLTNQTEQPPSSRESFGFPEHDAWDESVYELGGRPFRCDVKLGFSYADSNGTITTRQIRTRAFVQWNDDDHLVLGFCNYRKANRSFLTSRMESVTDLESGKYIYDIDRHLTEAYATSDYKKVDAFIDTRMSVVECLLYLAKLDGTITKTQKSLIIGYISGKCGVAMVTDLVANKLIKEFAEDLTPQNFRKLISQMRKEQPENLSELRYLGPEVVSARRSSNAGGKAALAAILDEGA